MDDRQPAVSCTSCGRSWHSASMAEGLRLLGACPRCKGCLEFRDAAATGSPPAAAPPADQATLAPHLVLGLPRRGF